MIRVLALCLAVSGAAAAALPAPARAQASLPDLPRPGERRGKSAAPPIEHAAPTLPTAARVAWPRLDPGAVVCRTRDDLRRHAEIIQARSNGTLYAGAAPDCRVLGVPAAIDVVNRESPAATEVKLRDPPAGTGWTDTWLPAQPPR